MTDVMAGRRDHGSVDVSPQSTRCVVVHVVRVTATAVPAVCSRPVAASRDGYGFDTPPLPETRRSLRTDVTARTRRRH